MKTTLLTQRVKMKGVAKFSSEIRQFCVLRAGSVFLLFLLPLVMAEPIKLYPIGDSTTYGYQTEYCWRYYLYKIFLKNGCDNIDFVGSTNGPTGGSIKDEWDRDHDGHSSWKASDILGSSKGNIKEWAPKYTPHIAVIYLGTNDIRGGRKTSDIIKTLKDIIKVLRDARKEVKIIMCQIPYWNYGKYGGKQSAVDALNKEIPSIKDLSTDISPIKIVDLNSDYSVSDHKDGIHPGITGAPKIADRLYEALVPWLEYDKTIHVAHNFVKQPGRTPSTKALRLSLQNSGAPTIWIAAEIGAASSKVRGWSINGKVIKH